jgi:hypothetical protein
VAGGLLAFCGAMAYAELAALRPAGRRRVRLPARGLWRARGFLTGWTSFIAGFAGADGRQRDDRSVLPGALRAGAANSTPWLQIPLPYLTLTVSNQS